MNQLRVDISKAQDIYCENCGSQFFEPATMFKMLSAILSPTGQETLVPIEVYACKNCNHVSDLFLPKFAKDDDEPSNESESSSNIIV